MTDSHLVHEALADLITALEGHLSACQRRLGDNDPEVQVAYETLRAAAQHYDDTLFDAFDEVTPFEVEPAAADDEPEELGAGGRFALLVRRDYLVDDVAALLEVGRRSQREVWQDEDDDTAMEDVEEPARAVYQMLHSQGVDGVAALAEDAGLVPMGGTLWVQVIDADDDTLTDDPFDVADEDLVVYRVDELYDEVDDVDELDELDEEALDEIESIEDEDDASAGSDDEGDAEDEGDEDDEDDRSEDRVGDAPTPR